MIIAVNTRLWGNGQPKGYSAFIYELLQRLAQQYPQHRFYFLSDQPFYSGLHFPGNVELLVIKPQARHPLLWKYWLDVKVPLMLKKIRADVFVSPDGFGSLTTRVLQCLVVPELPFLRPAGTYPKSHSLFYKRYTPKFLQKATTVVTLSQLAKNKLVQQYKLGEQKIGVIPPAIGGDFQPLEWEAQAAIKEKYTEGKEFFIYTGALQPHNHLVNLLKAFSFFKKRQKSGMKLVLTGGAADPAYAFSELLKTYKYRQDVVLLPEVPEADMAPLVGAAYAFVDPVNESFSVPVLQAMQSGVPVLTAANSGMQEVAEDAALYFDPAQVHDMADKLMLVYKDENLRSNLIEKATPLCKKYSWQQTVEAFWHCIADAVKP